MIRPEITISEDKETWQRGQVEKEEKKGHKERTV